MHLLKLWFSPDIGTGVGLHDHMVALFLVLQGTSVLFSLMVVPISFPPTMQEGSVFSTPSPGFIVCRLFDDGHSDLCEVIPHSTSDLHFSNN